MKKFTIGWYVLYTRFRHEKKALHKLDEMNIENFLPTTKVLRTLHDRKKYVDMPLFPSYIFVHLQDTQSYYDGLEIEGVLNYVKFGKEIARVNPAIINSIKILAGQGREIEVSSEYFRPGQQAYIQDGPFTGLSCEIVQLNGKQKVLVRVTLLQRNLLMALPSQSLLAVSA